ncbi:MAG: AAC(3) family N-acetyltransferase [Thermoplasmata archaeon]|nr:AAC(3) family N-acetyltransferase [Thermoplasmata archaeon]
MTEADVVKGTTGGPVTQADLERDLRRLGVAEGLTVLVHTSLSRLGWIVGGGQAVLLALEAAVGSDGTLMMPAFVEGVPEPSRWRDPPVPESWWTTIREEMPPWDPAVSPTRQVGVVADILRHQPGTLQSFHPNKSFVARGPNAHTLLDGHSLDDGFGEGSPLARLCEIDGWVLLLGVGHGNNTSLHLAEYRANWPGRRTPVLLSGRLVRAGRVESVKFVDVDGTSDDFDRLGAEYERQGGAVAVGAVGRGTGRWLRMRPMVDFAVDWIEANR